MRENCFYVPGEMWLTDFVRPDGTSEVYGETLEEIAKRHPGVMILDYETAANDIYEAIRSGLCNGPIEITFSIFHEMLGEIPPLQWIQTEAGESFLLSELKIRNFGQFYVRVKDRYFEITEETSTTHDVLVNMVKNHIDKKGGG